MFDDVLDLPENPYKKDLFGLLGMPNVAEFTWNGQYYNLCSIERESGCGSSFNVVVRDGNGNEFTLFIRTAD